MKQAICNFRGVSTLDVLNKNLRIFFLLLVGMALSVTIYGGHSVLDLIDPSFNPQIQISTFGVKSTSVVLPLSNGKILVSGVFNSYNNQTVGGLVRLNADATLDTSFNNNLFFSSSSVVRIIPLTDGKTLVCGTLTIHAQPGGNPFPEIVRLNTDGTLDTTFSYTGGGTVTDCAVDASGRIVMSGSFSGSGANTQRVVRLNADGSLDTSLQFVSDQTAISIATQNNKAIVALSPDGITTSMVTRLNEDGTSDSSFTNKNLNNLVRKLIVQPDAKILVIDRRSLLRLNENGGDDGSFTATTFPSDAGTMFLSTDGRITLSHGSGSSAQIKRFLGDGTADSSFTTYQPTGYRTFGLQTNGGVIIGDFYNGGNPISIPNFFSRLNPDGSLDTSFNQGGMGFQSLSVGGGNVRAIGVLANGKIIVGGNFNLINGHTRFKIARLNADSTIDESFQITTSGTGDRFTNIFEFYHVAVQPDGKLIVSGNFTYFINGIEKTNLVRLNSDGSIDQTFVIGTRVRDLFACCGGGTNKPIIMNNGKVLVGTSRSNNLPNIAPVRFNSDGTVDTSLNSALYPTSSTMYMMDIALQPDGKIIVGGSYTIHGTINDPVIAKSFITRLNPDGSLDQSFQTGEESSKQIGAIALLPNGKILISKYAGSGGIGTQNLLLRLNSDGSPDNSFNAGTGAGGKINTMLVLPTGRIFVGGLFFGFNGQTQENLAQLNGDGSLVPITYRFNNEVQNLALDNEGAVLVVGRFTSATVNGGNANRTAFVRLIDSTTSTRTRFDFDGDGRADLAAFTQSSGNWSILNSRFNELQTTRFGLSDDKTTAADFDGDGKTDIAVYRPGTGIWYLLRSRDGFAGLPWGISEDKPVAADYDGDGKADVAVWRPSTGVWYILQSSNNQLFAVQFGLAGDIPLTSSDFDADGKADIAVWRPSDGNFYWLASGAGLQFRAVHFGQAGDIPSVGDFNGDGKSDLVVFRPTEGNWYQYLTTVSGGYSFAVTQFGLNGDEPIAADYDGDGKTDIAVRRQNTWHILRSSQGYMSRVFANTVDTAIAAIPAP